MTHTRYHPELDASPVLDDYHANYHQIIIGGLKLAVDVVRINIHVEVSYLSCCLVHS